MKRLPLALIASLALASTASAASVAGTDFLNFTYPDPFSATSTVTVANGEFTRDTPDDKLFFRVEKVVRGDLGLDGSKEAIVVTSASGGGSGQFTDGLVYADVNGEATLIASLGVGDRAEGGVFDVRILAGRIVSERYSERNSGACCPTQIDTTVLRRSGSRLVRVGPTTSRAYVYAGAGSVTQPVKLRFLRGTPDGTAAGDGFRPEVVTFAGTKGQRLTVFARRPARAGKVVPVRVAIRRGSRTLLTLRPGQRRSVILPSSGTYVVRFSTTAHDSAAGDADVAADITLGPVRDR